jgi:hypothetical protein
MPGGRRVVFLGGAESLQLEEGGKTYVPGDIVQLPDIQRASLMQTGLRFGEVPETPEPEPAPDPPPALESADVSAAVIEARPLPVAPPTPADTTPRAAKAPTGKGDK